jgi:threonine dehydrogenase-like Zn-dependent dehydrogenase
MRAVVFSEPGKIEVRDVAIPEIDPNEVLIRPMSVGICHSDFDLLQGNYFLPLQWPIIPGHEYAGEVVKVGAEVREFKPGDRVVGECAVDWESTCEKNTTGDVICGTVGKDFGFTIDGAMAEYTKAKASWLHLLPANLTYTEGALVEPFTVGYTSIASIGGVDPADTVLILGAGIIGLSALITACGQGARVIVVDRQETRLNLATALGAHGVVDTEKSELVDRVLELTDGRGADVTVDAVGADALMPKLFDLTAQGGRVSMTGQNFNNSLAVPLCKIQQKELTVKGNIGSRFVWKRAIRFLSQAKPDLAKLCSAEYPLAEAVDAFATASDPAKATKVHLIP